MSWSSASREAARENVTLWEIGMESTDRGALMFRCPKTGEAFDSGFRFSAEEFSFVPTGYSMKLRCKICRELHELKLSEAWIAKPDGKES
jgi:hypothetical protein